MTGEQRDRVVSIGLTGALAAGKSTALAYFRELGACTIAADEVVSRLYERSEIRDEVRTRFGEEVLTPAGRVNREILGRLVARDAGGLSWLENLLHPLVGQELRRFLVDAQPGAVVVCEVPLLFQSGLQSIFDLTVTIEADREARRARRRARGGADFMDDLDKLQMASEERVRLSDLVYFNDGSLEELRAFVAAAFEVAQARPAPRDSVSPSTGDGLEESAE